MPGSEELGKIERIDAREIWTHEATEFTPWLHDHIAELNEAIGFDIEVEERERKVGPFAVDLFGHELNTGHPAIIENQLGLTDHTHLGQLITYASGLRAGVIVWVAPRFRDEHREALAWLNDVTGEDVNFFGVEIEVLEINGQRAPYFKLVAEPNEWRKSGSDPPRSREPSDRMQAYQEFFARVLSRFKAVRPGVTSARRTQALNWFGFSAGKSGIIFNWSFIQDGRFLCQVYIDHGDEEENGRIFDAVQSRLDGVTSVDLVWDRLDERRACRIAAYAPWRVTIEAPEEERTRLEDWAVATMAELLDAFRPAIKALE